MPAGIEAIVQGDHPKPVAGKRMQGGIEARGGRVPAHEHPGRILEE
jgi:hypothetical protein